MPARPIDTQPGDANPSRAVPVKAAAVAHKASSSSSTFLAGDPVPFDRLAHPEVDLAKRNGMMRVILVEAWVIAALVVVLVLGQPFFKPIYQYAGLNDTKDLVPMVALPMPNLTNKAVLSWATTSVTEVMTFGFADVDDKILAQKWRFTEDGWYGFVRAFLDQKVGEKFMQNRMVLTTVPSDAAIIHSQGPRPDGVYQWVVHLPIVMTYATNDQKKTQERTTIQLTIVRTKENVIGIAIDNWTITQAN